MKNDIVLENRPVRLVLPNKLKGSLVRAQVDEGLSQITETVIEFISPDNKLDLKKIVGERLRLEIDAPDGSGSKTGKKVRYFQGHCVMADYLGSYQGQGYFRASVRPWLWFLTQTSNCRIFQKMSVIQIIKKIFHDRKFSDFDFIVTYEHYQVREYCVQYRESDFAFISRLMEEEGIYYYHSHDETKETLIFADGASAHKALEDKAEIKFHFSESAYRRDDDHIFEWRGGESIQTGKVTLQDYDFERAGADLKSVKALAMGRNAYNSFEVYDYPGRYRNTDIGEHHALVKVEGFASNCQRSHGACNVRQMAAGGTFTLKDHPRTTENAEYLVISARHQLHIDADIHDPEITQAILGPTLDFDRSNTSDSYRSVIEVQPVNKPYRAPQLTPRPEIPGLQTAVVFGNPGEEICTDEYGRVKVHFHWDHIGGKNATASCWIRTAVPWSGTNWGMIGVPRVGQEVIVQFENGDPDRPVITGMVYNGVTKVPYTLPANQTQVGIKTNSSKGGGGYNELLFEDKKGAEFVRLQSERDFKQIIKNNAEITIGLEHKDGGFLTQTIYGDKTETIQEGNHSFTVAKGEEKIDISKKRSTKIGGADELTVTEDQSVSILGEKTERVSKGYEIDVGSTLDISANSRITLRCGNSKIEMTPSKVTVSSKQIDIDATEMARLAANGQTKIEGMGLLTLESTGMTQMESSGLLILNSSLTMIN